MAWSETEEDVAPEESGDVVDESRDAADVSLLVEAGAYSDEVGSVALLAKMLLLLK